MGTKREETSEGMEATHSFGSALGRKLGEDLQGAVVQLGGTDWKMRMDRPWGETLELLRNVSGKNQFTFNIIFPLNENELPPPPGRAPIPPPGITTETTTSTYLPRRGFPEQISPPPVADSSAFGGVQLFVNRSSTLHHPPLNDGIATTLASQPVSTRATLHEVIHADQPEAPGPTLGVSAYRGDPFPFPAVQPLPYFGANFPQAPSVIEPSYDWNSAIHHPPIDGAMGNSQAIRSATVPGPTTTTTTTTHEHQEGVGASPFNGTPALIPMPAPTVQVDPITVANDGATSSRRPCGTCVVAKKRCILLQGRTDLCKLCDRRGRTVCDSHFRVSALASTQA